MGGGVGVALDRLARGASAVRHFGSWRLQPALTAMCWKSHWRSCLTWPPSAAARQTSTFRIPRCCEAGAGCPQVPERDRMSWPVHLCDGCFCRREEGVPSAVIARRAWRRGTWRVRMPVPCIRMTARREPASYRIHGRRRNVAVWPGGGEQPRAARSRCRPAPWHNNRTAGCLHPPTCRESRCTSAELSAPGSLYGAWTRLRCRVIRKRNLAAKVTRFTLSTGRLRCSIGSTWQPRTTSGNTSRSLQISKGSWVESLSRDCAAACLPGCAFQSGCNSTVCGHLIRR